MRPRELLAPRPSRALNRATLADGVRALSAVDPDLAALAARNGLPPMWARRPGFRTLVHIVLEQQVSIAAARTLFRRVSAAVGGMTPERVAECGILGLHRLCITRQKASYCHALAIAVLVRLPELDRRANQALVIAGAISAMALAPFLFPYYEVSRDQGLVRSVNEVAHYSAGWRDYLVTGGRLHYTLWSHAFFEGRTALFPGVTAVILSAIAIANPRYLRDPRVRMTAAIGLLGLAFSFGPSLPGYAWLHEHVPLLGGIRNAARWCWLLLAAVAILAGFGAAALETANPRAWRLMPALVCALVTIESIRTPVGYTPFTAIPRIYDRLANESTAVVAEFPFYSGGSVSRNGPYVPANTRYFKPLMNGYSGFQPA